MTRNSIAQIQGRHEPKGPPDPSLTHHARPFEGQSQLNSGRVLGKRGHLLHKLIKMTQWLQERPWDTPVSPCGQFTRCGHFPGGDRPLLREYCPVSYGAMPFGFFQTRVWSARQNLLVLVLVRVSFTIEMIKQSASRHGNLNALACPPRWSTTRSSKGMLPHENELEKQRNTETETEREREGQCDIETATKTERGSEGVECRYHDGDLRVRLMSPWRRCHMQTLITHKLGSNTCLLYHY